MICRVRWLETASHTVRLLCGLLLEGMMNGNSEKPAVSTMPATDRALDASAAIERPRTEKRIACAAPPKPSSGAMTIHW